MENNLNKNYFQNSFKSSETSTFNSCLNQVKLQLLTPVFPVQ